MVSQFLLGAEQEQQARVVEGRCGVDRCHPAGPDVTDHLAVVCQSFRHRHHREVPAEELSVSGVFAEDQAPHVGVQPVGTDHDVEAAWRGVLEAHPSVRGDGCDRVAEQVFGVMAAGLVVDLTEIVAHDLDMLVGRGAEDLGEIDANWPPRALAIPGQGFGPGGQRFDLR